MRSYVGESDCYCNVYVALNKRVLRYLLNVKNVLISRMSAGNWFEDEFGAF